MAFDQALYAAQSKARYEMEILAGKLVQDAIEIIAIGSDLELYAELLVNVYPVHVSVNARQEYISITVFGDVPGETEVTRQNRMFSHGRIEINYRFQLAAYHVVEGALSITK